MWPTGSERRTSATAVPREEEQNHGPELILKIITQENFPKIGQDLHSHTEGLSKHLRKLTPNN